MANSVLLFILICVVLQMSGVEVFQFLGWIFGKVTYALLKGIKKGVDSTNLW